MYEPKPMGHGQPVFAVSLAEMAAHGRLVLYTGAGLSRGKPSEIPVGAEVARRVHARLVDLLGAEVLAGSDPSNLVSVADVVASTPGGIDLVRRTAVGVAEFTTADPNFGHEVIALLLLEGAVATITTNWDDCIERAGGAERVLAVVSDRDRQEIHTPALLKVHGCATRPDSVLVSTNDLATPPVWARDEINNRLADSHAVFVGIGDVAGYVRVRIEEAINAVGDRTAIYVASPSIGEQWTESQWAQILPDLPEDHRLPMVADQFLDELAAACVRRKMRTIAEAIEDQVDTCEAFMRAVTAIDVVTSVDALRWLRASAVPRIAGTSVMDQQAFTLALVALGKLAGTSIEFLPNARARVDHEVYEVLVGVGNVTATRFRRDADARLIRYRSAGGDLSVAPTYLVAGSIGRLDASIGPQHDVLGGDDTMDLVAGPLAVGPRFLHAEDVAS